MEIMGDIVIYITEVCDKVGTWDIYSQIRH